MDFTGALENGVTGGVTSAVGSLFSGAVNQLFNSISMARQFKYSQRAADADLARQKQYFDYVNAYNTPSAIRDRLTAAGINVASALGDGGTSFGASTPGSAGHSGVGPAGGSGAGMMSPAEIGQYSALDAKANYDNAMADYVRATTPDREDFDRGYKGNAAYYEYRAASEKFDLDLKSDLRSITVEKAESDLRDLKARVENREFEKRYLNASADERKSMVAANLTQAYLNFYAAELNKEKKHLIPEERRLLEARVYEAYRSGDLAAANAKTADALRDKTVERTDSETRRNIAAAAKSNADTEFVNKRTAYEGWRACSEIALNYSSSVSSVVSGLRGSSSVAARAASRQMMSFFSSTTVD